MDQYKQDALDAAYEDQLAELLGVLTSNIAQGEADPQEKFDKGLQNLDVAYNIAHDLMDGPKGAPQVGPLVRTPEGLRTFLMDSISSVLNNWLTSKWLSADAKLVLKGEYIYWQQADVPTLMKLLNLVPPV